MPLIQLTKTILLSLTNRISLEHKFWHSQASLTATSNKITTSMANGTLLEGFIFMAFKWPLSNIAIAIIISFTCNLAKFFYIEGFVTTWAFCNIDIGTLPFNILQVNWKNFDGLNFEAKSTLENIGIFNTS